MESWIRQGVSGLSDEEAAFILYLEGQRVKLTMEVPSANEDNLIELAGQVYEDLSEKEIEDVELLARDRSDFIPDH